MGECRGGEAGGPQWCTGGTTGWCGCEWVGGMYACVLCACVCTHLYVVVCACVVVACLYLCMCSGVCVCL